MELLDGAQPSDIENSASPPGYNCLTAIIPITTFPYYCYKRLWFKGRQRRSVRKSMLFLFNGRCWSCKFETQAIGKLWRSMCSKLAQCLLVVSETQKCPWGCGFSAKFGNNLEKIKRQNLKVTWAQLSECYTTITEKVRGCTILTNKDDKSQGIKGTKKN